MEPSFNALDDLAPSCGGCIGQSCERATPTAVGENHLRAELRTLRERGLSNRRTEASDRADLLYGATRSVGVYRLTPMEVTVDSQLVLNPDFL
jgi:hypothetical protein